MWKRKRSRKRRGVGKCTSRSGKISEFEHEDDEDEEEEDEDRRSETSAELSLLFYYSLFHYSYFSFTRKGGACKFSDSCIVIIFSPQNLLLECGIFFLISVLIPLVERATGCILSATRRALLSAGVGFGEINTSSSSYRSLLFSLRQQLQLCYM